MKPRTPGRHYSTFSRLPAECMQKQLTASEGNRFINDHDL